jgi:hypothetical protein
VCCGLDERDTTLVNTAARDGRGVRIGIPQAPGQAGKTTPTLWCRDRTKGSLVEPYWCSPQLAAADINDPASPDFHNPTWWRIHDKPYHRSHLVQTDVLLRRDVRAAEDIFCASMPPSGRRTRRWR